MAEKPVVEKNTEERVVKTLCGMCATRCGIDVHLRGDTIIKIEPMKEHPARRLCVKSQAIPDFQYSKDRLRYPMKRVGNEWHRISWDDALAIIASKLNYLRERYGSESLAIGLGHGPFIKEPLGLARLFAQAHGTPNITGVSNMCGYPKWISNILTFGADTVHELGKTKCMICWALNSWHSQTPARHTIDSFKEKGVKLIVVDPRRTYEAKIADLHLRPRPGTDLALVLSMLNIIISEGLYDKEFVDKWTIGFEELAQAVQEYTPEWAEKVTSVPAGDVLECAHMYASIKPASIGTMSCLEQSTNAFKVFRALASLIAITGNLEVAGGNKQVPPAPGRLLRFDLEDEDYVLTKKTFSADEIPLYEEVAKNANSAYFADTILTGKPYPIKAFIVQGCNPLRSFANTNKLKRAFEELDFIVVMDHFMTDFAEMAHIVLPAASFLEHRWVHAYYVAHLPLVSVADKVFDLSDESWPDARFWIDLGKRMGYEEYFPWDDEDDLIQKNILGPLGKTFADLEESPQGFFYAPRVPDRPASERTEPFKTPSGKVELYSERVAKMGYPPLPVPYEEPLESPVTRPELFKEYPLIALTGIRSHAYEHTWGRNLPTLRRVTPDPEVEINPKDAEKHGVEQGEWVFIESPKGRVKMKTRITDDILEGLVAMPHGWGGECNVNLITNDEERGIVLGTTPTKGLACRLTKIN